MVLMASSLSSGLRIVSLSQNVWRSAAARHQQNIKDLLEPGLTPLDHQLNSGHLRQGGGGGSVAHDWTALDPKNPVYNFLIEYYGLKGMRGPRKLAKWSPNMSLLFSKLERIEHEEELSSSTEQVDPLVRNFDGVFLEGAIESDFANILMLRGTEIYDKGVLFAPSNLYPNEKKNRSEHGLGFEWYLQLLKNTLNASPILHCHGLHEWAMQYQPEGSPPPPSAKYQGHLPLRVPQSVINEAVERRGVSCTHVDALRFFAPAASPLNHYGSGLGRSDQLRLEQPACVHAQMDLLKICLKLRPFVADFTPNNLLVDALRLSLAARRLDVAASPYDAKEYGVGVVQIETSEGRALYRQEQLALMEQAEPIRQRLIQAYETFLEVAFEKQDQSFDSRVLEFGSKKNQDTVRNIASKSP